MYNYIYKNKCIAGGMICQRDKHAVQQKQDKELQCPDRNWLSKFRCHCQREKNSIKKLITRRTINRHAMYNIITELPYKKMLHYIRTSLKIYLCALQKCIHSSE